MTNVLPSPWKLIQDSWHTFLKTWSTVAPYAAWIALGSVVLNAGLLVPTEREALQITVLWLGFIVGLLITIWTSIRLYQVTLSLEAGQSITAKTTATAMALIPSILLVGIFQGLATLGGLVLFLLPGIYVGVRLAFAQLITIDKGTRGRAALVASWELTKNRFWALLGRQLAAGVLFTVLIMIVSAVIMLIIGLFMGGIEYLEAAVESGLGAFLLGVLNGILQAALIPLMVVFQIKLYRAVSRA